MTGQPSTGGDTSATFTSDTYGAFVSRGKTSHLTGADNVLSGTGFRPVDARADASMPALSSTDTSSSVHHAKITPWSYLRFHPLAFMWLSILSLVVLGALWSRRRRLPPHPHPESTRWRLEAAGRSC